MRIVQTIGTLVVLLAMVQTVADSSTPNDQQLFAHVKEIPSLIEKGQLAPAQIPNPHWRDGACHACHAGNPNARPAKLRDPDINRLCQFCHDAIFDHSYTHSVAVSPDKEMIARMPASYQNALAGTDRTMSCATCHDLVTQCLSEHRNKKASNPRFFRDGPFQTRTEQCYFCHDARKYERLSPHEQVGDDGRIRRGTCKLCHVEDVDALRKVDDITELRFTVGTDLAALCTRCHLREPHPGGQFGFETQTEQPNHLVRPPDSIRERMRLRAEQTGLTLPLEPGSGKIFCATCHEPHEAGAIENREITKDPTVKNRLRGPDMCLRCHTK